MQVKLLFIYHRTPNFNVQSITILFMVYNQFDKKSLVMIEGGWLNVRLFLSCSFEDRAIFHVSQLSFDGGSGGFMGPLQIDR